MVESKRAYRSLKGIRSSLKTEVSRIEEELNRGDASIQSDNEDDVNSLLDLKTRLRKEFDNVSKSKGPYKK